MNYLSVFALWMVRSIWVFFSHQKQVNPNLNNIILDEPTKVCILRSTNAWWVNLPWQSEKQEFTTWYNKGNILTFVCLGSLDSITHEEMKMETVSSHCSLYFRNGGRIHYTDMIQELWVLELPVRCVEPPLVPKNLVLSFLAWCRCRRRTWGCSRCQMS